MAKRKNQLADKLSAPKKQPGWRDILRPPEADVVAAAPETTPEIVEEQGEPTTKRTKPKQPKAKAKAVPAHGFVRKTYLLSPTLIDRISDAADDEAVGINELVRYLLNFALSEIDTGNHKLPTKPSKRKIQS